MSITAGQMSFENARVLIFGATGAQGRSIVQVTVSISNRQNMLIVLALARTKRYRVSVLTRNKSQPKPQHWYLPFRTSNSLKARTRQRYTTEEGLRATFANQDVVYFCMDSLSVGEPYEYFWTFRAYEIAVQSRLKWLSMLVLEIDMAA